MNMKEFKNTTSLEKYILEQKYSSLSSDEWRKEKIVISIAGRSIAFPILRAYFNLRVGLKLIECFDVNTVFENLYRKESSGSSNNKYINQIMNLSDDEEFRNSIAVYVSESFLRVAQFLENVVSYDISYFDIFEMCEKDPVAERIIIDGPTVSNLNSPWEISEIKKETLKELKEIVERNKIEPYYSFIKSQSSMRIPQFTDCLGIIGANPNEDTVIPYLVPESWCRGIQHPTSFLVQAKTARVAKIMEKCKISSTGSALKDDMFVNKGLMVKDGDCGTKHFLKMLINDEQDLKTLKGMNYTLVENSGNFKKISLEDTDLIGKTIFLRSPATCAMLDANHLCSECCGVPIRKKFDIGLDCTMKITGEAGQIVLSAKHINILIAMKHIKDEFLKYIKNTIENKLLVSDAVANIYFMHPKVNDARTVAETSTIEVELTNGKLVHIEIIDTTVSTYPNNLDENGRVIHLDDISITNKNRSKSKLFYIIKRLIGSENKLSYEEIVSQLYSACRETYHGVQIFTFISQHLRDPNNIYKRFDFRDARLSLSDGVFASVNKILNLQPLTDSLQHGKMVMENFLTSPESFNGVRPENSDMDVILVPRRMEDIIKLVEEYDMKVEYEDDIDDR